MLVEIPTHKANMFRDFLELKELNYEEELISPDAILFDIQCSFEYSETICREVRLIKILEPYSLSKWFYK